ncbi:hypothetical protein B0O80DRAFT_432602, partial [Mortierella sp. GBAus27b]
MSSGSGKRGPDRPDRVFYWWLGRDAGMRAKLSLHGQGKRGNGHYTNWRGEVLMNHGRAKQLRHL